MNIGAWIAVAASTVVLGVAGYWAWFIWGPSRFGRRVRLEHAGHKRSYLLHVPKDLDGPVPLVLVMHGAYDWAKRLADITHWDRLADEEGFIVAFPEGTHPGFPRVAQAWNAGHCCLHAVAKGIPDVEFLFHVRDHIALGHPVSELYLAGFSNGGMLAYRAAADRPEEVAGVAAVGSALWSGAKDGPPHWRPERLPRIPVVHIHGANDLIVPYNGGPGRSTPRWSWCTVDETLEAWRTAWDAAPGPWQRVAPTVERRAYAADNGTPVVLFRHEAGHSWPQGPRPFFLEAADPNLDAEREIWQHWRAAAGAA